MSAGSSGGEGEGQDFELNLAPIIDCFTVLITYMLVSASFISLDMLEVTVAASSPPIEGTPPPVVDEIPTTVSAQVGVDGSIVLQVSGKEEAKFEARDETLPAKAAEVLGRWPALKEINIKAEPKVSYKMIIRTTELLKKSFAKVYLGE